MAKTDIELGKKRGERVKELIKAHNMTQEELAYKIGYTPTHLSAVLNGRRSLTVEAAQSISELFPATRYQWIMCFDDFKTDNEKAIKKISDINSEWQSRLSAVRILAYLSGYDIELFKENNTDSDPIEYVLRSVKEGYKIIKDGVTIATIPIDRFNLLALDVQELTEQRIKSFLREL